MTPKERAANYMKLKEGHIVYENKKGEEKQSRDWYFRVPFKYFGILDLSKEKNNFLLPEKKFSSLPSEFELQFKAEVRNYESNKIITFSVTNITGAGFTDENPKEKFRRLDDKSIFQSNLRIFSEAL